MQQEKPIWKILTLFFAALTVGSGFFFHYDTKHSTESKIVEALSERYASVDKEMSYEQALEAVDRDVEKLKSDNSMLLSELSSLQNELNEVQSAFAYSNERSDKIARAESYAIQGDYATAIPILNSIVERTEDVTAMLKDYTLKYEAQIVSELDNLVSERQFDEAVNLIEKALHIVPNSPALTAKRTEIENKKPITMYLVDALTPYTSDDFEVIPGSLEMGGERYKKSFTLQGYGWNGVSNATYNLKGQYTSLSFTIAVIQSEGGLNNREQIDIWLDDDLIETIDMSIEDIPKQYTFSLANVQRLKFEIPRGNGFHSLVGIAEAMLYK